MSNRIRRLFDEPVTQPNDGFDLLSRDLELATQTTDVDVNRSRFDNPVVAPHALEQPVARYHAVPVVDQVSKQLEFPPRETNVLAVYDDGHGVEVSDKMLAAVDGGQVSDP